MPDGVRGLGNTLSDYCPTDLAKSGCSVDLSLDLEAKRRAAACASFPPRGIALFEKIAREEGEFQYARV